MAKTQNFVENIWYFAALSRDIKPDTMQAIVLAGHPINLGRRKDGKLFAISDICPHRAAPLSAGRIVGDVVECPYHGWQFDQESGQCKLIPAICDHQKNPATGIKITTYPVRQNGQLIWIYLAAQKQSAAAPPLDPPDIPLAHLKPRVVKHMVLNCHVDHAVIGLMDPAHGPFVHGQWWWRSKKSIHEKAKAFKPIKHGFAMSAHKPSRNSLAYKILGGTPVTEIRFYLPGIRVEEITVGARTLLSLTTVTPIDSQTTKISQMFFSDHGVVKALSPFMGPFVKAFLHQDGHMVDLQQKGLAYDPNLMLIDDADRQAKWYYMLKKEWASSYAQNRKFKNPVKEAVLHWRS